MEPIDNENCICIKQIGKGSFSNVYLFENKECISSLSLSSLFTNVKLQEPFFIIKEMDLSKLVHKYLYKGNPVANKIKYRPTFKNEPILIKNNSLETIEDKNGIEIKNYLKETTSVNITPYHIPGKNFNQPKIDYTEEEYYYIRLRELIESEILILRNLNHQNIIKYFGSSILNDVYSIKMEYCNLGDLYSLLKEKGNKQSLDYQKHIYNLKKQRNFFGGFDDTFIKDFIKDTVSALIFISNTNIIHRDIKLHNILVKYCSNQNKFVFKLSDFGFSCYDLSNDVIENDLSISSFLNITPESLKRKYFKLCGTPYYMAPEIILNLNKFEQLIGICDNKNDVKLYDKKSDMWSFGICLYELIFNNLPFPNLSNMNDIKMFFTDMSSQEHIYTNINDQGILSDTSKNILKKLLTINPIQRISINDLEKVNLNNILIKNVSEKHNIKVTVLNMNSWVFENTGDLNLKESWHSVTLTTSSLIMKMSIDKSFKRWLKE